MFTQTEIFLKLVELERQLKKIRDGVNDNMKNFNKEKLWKCREAGRSIGFSVAANMVGEMIDRMYK